VKTIANSANFCVKRKEKERDAPCLSNIEGGSGAEGGGESRKGSLNYGLNSEKDKTTRSWGSAFAKTGKE